MTLCPRGAAAVVGVGETAYVRGSELTEQDLMLEASVRACRDAGIDPHDIDGIVAPAIHEVKAEDLLCGLGFDDLRWSVRVELGGASSAAAVGHAAAAVASGAARHVLVPTGWKAYSTVGFSNAREDLLSELAKLFPTPSIRFGIEYPHGVFVPLQYYAFHARRWIDEFALGDAAVDAMAAVSIGQRASAQTNPRAVMRGKPMDRAAYDASPLIAEPLRLLDCCLETDGAAAVVVSSASDGGVAILAAAEGRPATPDDVVSRPDMLDLGLAKAAPRAYAEARVGPEDVAFACVYDNFSFMVLRQLEELGFCARGESPAFVRERGIGLDGGLPVNPHGGLMSEAHVAGMNHVLEAVRQLRGDAANQLDAPRLGLVTGMGGTADGSILILGEAA